MDLETVYQINARNTHVAKNLPFIMKSTFPGVLTLTGENCINIITIFEAQYLPLFTSVLIIILSVDNFS